MRTEQRRHGTSSHAVTDSAPNTITMPGPASQPALRGRLAADPCRGPDTYRRSGPLATMGASGQAITRPEWPPGLPAMSAHEAMTKGSEQDDSEQLRCEQGDQPGPPGRVDGHGVSCRWGWCDMEVRHPGH